jgi:TM2 domain-containing membrane protein YozV
MDGEASREAEYNCNKVRSGPRRRMGELGAAELMSYPQGMSEQQRFMFQAQYNGARRDRTLILIVSILVGALGIDRFLVGDVGMGLLKLFTCGGLGILWFIDLFLIMNRADEYNRRKAQEIAMFIRVNTPHS